MYDPDFDASENLARALFEVASQLKWLGNGDAGTSLGAIEAHGEAMVTAAEKIREGLLAVAEAIAGREG